QFSQLSHLPLVAVSGQTTVVNSTPVSQRLACVIAGDGYISPTWQHKHCYGATAHIGQTSAQLTLRDHQLNLAKLATFANELVTAFEPQYQTANLLQGHAAIRCTSTDRLPLVGPVSEQHTFRQHYARLAVD